MGEWTTESERLLGCWTLLPPQTGEVVGPYFFTEMKAKRIAALRAFPTPHNYLLNRTVFGSFLDEVCERCIPLLLSLTRGASWPIIYQLLQEYPTLTCIACDIGIWGQDRYTWPLLENYSNFFIETSQLSLEAGGLQTAVKKFGAGRFLFGTGYPYLYAESALLALLHADISEEDRREIASGNLERLLGEVRL